MITAKDRLACARVLGCNAVWSTGVPRGRAYGIKPVAFKTDGVEGGKRKVELCGCKYTNTPPYCDGSVRAASLACRSLLLHHTTTTCYSRTGDASPFVLVCLFDFCGNSSSHVATPPRNPPCPYLDGAFRAACGTESEGKHRGKGLGNP